MALSKQRALEILKGKGIDIRQLASNPGVFERSCSLIYKAIPIPLRWFVGKKRVRRVVESLRSRL